MRLFQSKNALSGHQHFKILPSDRDPLEYICLKRPYVVLRKTSGSALTTAD